MIALALAASLTAAALTGQMAVIDGDTLGLGDTRIRLHAVDAPEAREQCVTLAAEVWDCGAESTRRLAGRIAGREISCAPRGRDRSGRVVAVCAVEGEDIGRWMVRSGWARSFPRYGRDYVPDEAEAKRARIGIWR